MKTMFGEELGKRKVNWICISIDSTGGNLDDCKELAETLADFGDDVQTVAYVPVEASGGAALIALSAINSSCNPKPTSASNRHTPSTSWSSKPPANPIRESLAKTLAP